VLGGGDVFHREIGGEIYRFSVFGLWGSGNVVTERNLIVTGENTAYSMWDGHALFGPGELALERYPALVDDIDLSEFLDRYGFLAGDDCQVWTGEEDLGIACPEACLNLSEVCAASDYDACVAECATWPRAISDCISSLTDCTLEALCNRDLWAAMQATTTSTP
jgi:hypothetical protein